MNGAGERGSHTGVGQDPWIPPRLRGSGYRCCMRFIDDGKTQLGGLYATMYLVCGQEWSDALAFIITRRHAARGCNEMDIRTTVGSQFQVPRLLILATPSFFDSKCMSRIMLLVVRPGNEWCSFVHMVLQERRASG